jgi:ribosomal protein S18 acetylase RimI-like enzyme
MTPIRMVGEVLEVMQKAKAGATNFQTNFFLVQTKLQGWIDHAELFSDQRAGVAFFFRKDRDFWRLYFCAASEAALQQELASAPWLKTERLMTDLVGNKDLLDALCPALEAANFRRYAQLQRMARPGRPESAADSGVDYAVASDCRDIVELIENSFDRYGEQLPARYEIESAIWNRQILVVRRDGRLAGLLFFETQGFASVIRFWVVAEKYRSFRVGSALMQHYLTTHAAIRRFTLWVNVNNAGAIRKYRHFGYAPDGLMDCVLAGELIRP